MTSDLLTIDGTLTIRERIAVPDGAIASIKLVDSTGEVLAATAVTTHSVPAAFTLHADTEFVPKDGHLLLWAAFRSEVGLWGTTDLVPVSGDSTEVVLSKIGA